MSGVWDALPFFGVLAFTICGGFTCMTRRMNALSRRLTNVEMAMTAPPKPVQSPPPAQVAWQQTTWPTYPNYSSVTYPYPSAPTQTQLM